MSPHVNILIPVALPEWWEKLAITRYRKHVGDDTTVTGSSFTPAQQKSANRGGLLDVLYENARAAEGAGAAVHVIDCFGDPELAELAARLDRPVTGVGHAAMHFAHGFAASYAVITSEGSGIEGILDNARAYGVDTKLAACEAVKIPAAEIPERREEALDRLESVAHEFDSVPDWIVLGCTELAELAPELEAGLRARGLAVRVLNPLIATIRWAEAAAQSVN
jgi:allantoin racemase